MNSHPTQRAALYRIPKRLLAYPERRTVSGFCLAGEPFVQIVKEDAMSVAAAVRFALESSGATVPDPKREDFPRLTQLRLEAAAVRTESAFMRQARLVSIQQSEEAIFVFPHRNGGSTGAKKGFEALTAKKITLPLSVADVDLGAACLQALALCE
jgi:hypothetical protein